MLKTGYYFSQPFLVYSKAINDFDDFLPANVDDANQFSSIEISSTKGRNAKREARPIINLIMDILDTFYTATKSEAKRSQFEKSISK